MDFELYVDCPICKGKGSLANSIPLERRMDCYLCCGSCVVTEEFHEQFVEWMSKFNAACAADDPEGDKSVVQGTLFDDEDLELWK